MGGYWRAILLRCLHLFLYGCRQRFVINFVSLQAGMKNVLTSLTAMMLVIWYSLSVIGFDVHTCSGSGKSYIATVASGFSCEDIHPESHDHHAHAGCSCCHSHESETTSQLDKKPCCSDDFQVIVLTGVRSGQETDIHDGPVSVQVDNCMVSAVQSLNAFYSGLRAFYKPRSWDIVPRDVQVSYNIWRI